MCGQAKRSEFAGPGAARRRRRITPALAVIAGLVLAPLLLAPLLLAPLALVPAPASTLDAAMAMVGDASFAPIDPPLSLDQRKLDLGRRLFEDRRLSGDGRLACSSCHDLLNGGDDGRARSVGADGRPLDYNTPTVFNAALNFRFNWRGNYRRLTAQNEAALLDPRIMAANWDGVLARLRADAGYATGFAQAYGRALRRQDVLDALAEFQRSLLTPGARFDRFLGAEPRALSQDERRGYELFRSYGCASCHQGRNLGGNLFQRFGIFANPFAGRGTGERADLGRFTVTGRESDRYVFRVPSLRNVALTAPYMHDGSAPTLARAVEIMGRSQLGIDLPPQDIDLIVGFLHSLSGEYRGRPLAPGNGGPP